jgi:periplasmic divalent cation tolerance protein
MKKAGEIRAVLVTAPNMKVARKLAQGAVASRLAACANVIAGVESHYWWNGKAEKSAEALIIFKTRAVRLGKLEKFVIENHPYDTPEFIALKISGGNRSYLNWLTRETGDAAK